MIVAYELRQAFHNEGFDLERVELLKKGTGSSAKTCGLAVVTCKEGVNIREVGLPSCCAKV